MVNIGKYIEDDRVMREKIAMDIKYGVISYKDIEVLLNDKRLESAFFGNGFSERIDKADWDKEYLDKLSYAVVAEAFNKDYLMYLYQVANYVNGRKRKKKILIVSSVIIIAVAIMIFIFSQQ